MVLAGSRQIESVAHDAIAPAPGKHCFLKRHLGICIEVETPAYFRVFALIVFTDNAEIDFSRREPFHWRMNTAQQPHWTKVYILLKRSADRDQQSPQRNMIRNTGISHRTEVDRIETAQLVQAIFGHHPAGLEIGLATPVEVMPGEHYIVAAPSSFKNTKAFGYDLTSDSVALNDRNVIMAHWTSLERRFEYAKEKGSGTYSEAVERTRSTARSSSAPPLCVKQNVQGGITFTH